MGIFSQHPRRGILKGFERLAQGWSEPDGRGTTLGKTTAISSTLKGLDQSPAGRTIQPLQGRIICGRWPGV